MEVPNGKSPTSVLLRDTLHAHDMGLTVVRISRIIGAGHTIPFEFVQNQEQSLAPMAQKTRLSAAVMARSGMG